MLRTDIQIRTHDTELVVLETELEMSRNLTNTRVHEWCLVWLGTAGIHSIQVLGWVRGIDLRIRSLRF